MKYAVISAAGKQYMVKEGQELVLDRINAAEEGKNHEFGEVLMVVDGEKRTIGTPTVKGAKVTAKVLAHGKGKKIRVATYKAKSRYRRVIGHRQSQTTFSITKIS